MRLTRQLFFVGVSSVFPCGSASAAVGDRKIRGRPIRFRRLSWSGAPPGRMPPFPDTARRWRREMSTMTAFPIFWWRPTLSIPAGPMREGLPVSGDRFGVVETPAWSNSGDNIEGAYFGASLALADLNGDRFADAVIGASNYRKGEKGRSLDGSMFIPEARRGFRISRSGPRRATSRRGLSSGRRSHRPEM